MRAMRKRKSTELHVRVFVQREIKELKSESAREKNAPFLILHTCLPPLHSHGSMDLAT